MPMPKLGGSGSGSGVGSGSGRACGIFPRAGAMILSRLLGTNISALRAAPGFRRRGAAGASTSGTRGDACGLAGCAAGGAGLGSGRSAECGAACGFGAGSATGCGLCGCGEDAPAPGACRGGTAASGDDFAIADGAAGAFGGTFAVVIAFATGFAAGGGVPAAALDGADAPADDGNIAAMALFALVITLPSHDVRLGFCAGGFDAPFAAACFCPVGRALTIAAAAGGLAIGAAGCGTAIGCAGRASGTRMALSGARPRRMAKPASIGTAARS